MRKQYLICLLLVLGVVLVGCGSHTIKQTTPEDFRQYIEIIEINLEQPIKDENHEFDIVKVKLKNISDKKIYGVSILFDYLNKNNKPFAKATAIYEFREIPPGYITVFQTPLGVFTNPKDIINDWSGKLYYKIIDVALTPDQSLKTQ